MAYVEFIDGQRQLYRKPDDIRRLVLVWRVITGQEKQPDPVTKLYASKVKKVRLNWHEAPEDYVRWNLNEILPSALREWAVDVHGNVLRPGNSRAWDFAKKYGLWKGGKPTPLVTGKQTTMV